VSLYGSSVAGVKALLPWRQITQDTKPSVTDVDGWLTGDEAALSAVVGDLVAVPDPGVRDRLTALAAQVVHHRVAARAEAAEPRGRPPPVQPPHRGGRCDRRHRPLLSRTGPGVVDVPGPSWVGRGEPAGLVVPVRLTLDVYGDVALDRSLERFNAVHDMRPAWEVLRHRFLEMERRQFATEGAAGRHGRWDPLSEGYARWKANHFPGKTILRRTDELFTSLTEGPAIDIEEPHELVLGSDVRHGAFHHNPSDTSRMPRRRVVDFAEDEAIEWMRVMHRYVVTGETD
jgi:hypothetical protein